MDSLLAISTPKYHTLSARTNFIGLVSNAGRIQDFKQNGYSAGVTYSHPSNFYLDVSSFLNTGYIPLYYLTAINVGFQKRYKPSLSLYLSHDFYVYNDTLTQPFNKAVQIGHYYKKKLFEFGADYSFLYGGQSAHRLQLSLSGVKKWKFNGLLKSLTISPNVSVLFGNADIVYWRQSTTPYYDVVDILESGHFPVLDQKAYRYLTYLFKQEKYPLSALFLRRKGFTDSEIQNVFLTYEE